jgi:hypothetical protein
MNLFLYKGINKRHKYKYSEKSTKITGAHAWHQNFTIKVLEQLSHAKLKISN